MTGKIKSMFFFFNYDKLTSRSNNRERTAVSIENTSLLSKPGLCTRLIFFNAHRNYGPMGTERKKQQNKKKIQHKPKNPCENAEKCHL